MTPCQASQDQIEREIEGKELQIQEKEKEIGEVRDEIEGLEARIKAKQDEINALCKLQCSFLKSSCLLGAIITLLITYIFSLTVLPILHPQNSKKMTGNRGNNKRAENSESNGDDTLLSQKTGKSSSLLRKLCEIKVELYQTSIIQDEKSLWRYWFEFVKNDKEMLYRSRKTIMDRPGWRNESFTVQLDALQYFNDKFVVIVYRSSREGNTNHSISEKISSNSGVKKSAVAMEKENIVEQGGVTRHEGSTGGPLSSSNAGAAHEVFDKVQFPNPFKQKGLHPLSSSSSQKITTHRPDVRFKIRSQKHPDTAYFFSLVWTQIAAVQRESEKLKLQKYGLELKLSTHEKKRKELFEEMQILESGRLRPYEQVYTEIKDEEMMRKADEHFNQFQARSRKSHILEYQSFGD